MTHWLITLLLLLRFELSANYKSSIFKNNYSDSHLHWKKLALLNPTEKKPTRIAILIIAPPQTGKSKVEMRWNLGKKAWEQYMKSHPNVDCFFIQSSYYNKNSATPAWIEGNTIFVGDSWYEKSQNDRLLNKTVKALELLLPNYTHFYRTNINAFFNLKNLYKYAETHHQSMYTTPLWEEQWFCIGYSMLFTKDVAAHICKEFQRLDQANEELIDCFHSDDCALTSLATGVWPLDFTNPFKCCPSLPLGTRQLMCKDSLHSKRFTRYGLLLTPITNLKEAISYCELANDDVFLYRIRDGLSLLEIAQFYHYILKKTYPELVEFDFVKYLNTLN